MYRFIALSLALLATLPAIADETSNVSKDSAKKLNHLRSFIIAPNMNSANTASTFRTYG